MNQRDPLVVAANLDAAIELMAARVTALRTLTAELAGEVESFELDLVGLDQTVSGLAAQLKELRLHHPKEGT